jgi:hypothetical protein
VLIPLQWSPLNLIIWAVYFCTLFLFVLEVYQQKQSPEYFKFKWPSYNNIYLIVPWVLFFILTLAFDHLRELCVIFLENFYNISFNPYINRIDIFIYSVICAIFQVFLIYGLLLIAEDSEVNQKQLSFLGKEGTKASVIDNILSLSKTCFARMRRILKIDGLKLFFYCVATFILLNIFNALLFFVQFYIFNGATGGSTLTFSSFAWGLLYRLLYPSLIYFILFEYYFSQTEKNTPVLSKSEG